ncbi:MAG: type II toxin-antitoxin system VapC family toxin [Sphingomonadales bacterium]|nr:type II toxin-antitoxin system VapC family toxin [Sphingomonadales bacterium]
MTAYLLDTHAAIWWWTSDAKLGAAAADVIAADVDTIYLSAASVWEVAIKSSAGKLPEIVDFENEYEPLMRANRFTRLTITDAHALRSGILPGAHRDPFDRLIAAQALIEDLTVITHDPEIAGFGCKVLW